MRENNGLHEYIAVYVDDLLIAAREPWEITSTLQESHKFKLKGVGLLMFHMVCDYFCGKDATLCYCPQKYIGKIMDQYENMFGSKPKEYTSPLEKSNHPEIDVTEELDDIGIRNYQTMIGCLQWAVSLGRFDIQTATMTISQFHAAPRIGHLNRLKRIHGYLKNFASAAILVRLLEPDLGEFPDQDFVWCHSVYSKVEEFLKDAPKQLGKPVTTITYTDDHLYHDMITGR
jgi:hypothetical protein